MSEGNGLNGIRYGIDPYLEWVNTEAMPVVEDYGVDLFQVETAEWPRFGMRGAAVHLEGTRRFLQHVRIRDSRGRLPARHSGISTKK